MHLSTYSLLSFFLFYKFLHLKDLPTKTFHTIFYLFLSESYINIR